MAFWIKEYDPSFVTPRLEKAKTISDDGEISFDGLGLSDNVVLLKSMLKINKEMPESEINRAVYKSVFQAGKKGEITAESILNEITKYEKKYFAKPLMKYRLFADVSISKLCNFRRINIDGSCIVVNPKLSEKIIQNRGKIISIAQNSIHGESPKSYTPVTVSVKARTTSEAADKAIEKLDLARSMWNYWHNYSRSLRFSFSSKRKPVNVFLLGPIWTLHKESGALATENWWYDPNYQGPIDIWKRNSYVDKLYKYMNYMRMLLAKSNYKSDIVRALLRYVRALDATYWEDAFLRLWSVIEFLTGTLYDSYKVTIRRSSFFYFDREYHYQMLYHLKEYRNRSVHAGSNTDDIEILLYQLKRYAEELINYHLTSSYKFKSIADAAEFLDMPRDKKIIKEKIGKLQYAQKMLANV